MRLHCKAKGRGLRTKSPDFEWRKKGEGFSKAWNATSVVQYINIFKDFKV